MQFETIWASILTHQNEIFTTERNLEFFYQIHGNTVHIFRNNRKINNNISKSDFEKVFNYRGNSRAEIRDTVRGSSYVIAVLRKIGTVSGSAFQNFNACSKKFFYAGKIKPCIDEAGDIITYFSYNTCDDYLNNPDYEVMDLPRIHPLITTTPHEVIGNQEFCTIDMAQLKLPKKSGVYLWVIDNIVVYIGRAINDTNESLYNRFNNGYSRISCRPCWKKVYPKIVRGQSTNMKMNLLVRNCYKNGTDVDLYYCEAEDAASLETELLRANWIYRDITRLSTCVYNERR